MSMSSNRKVTRRQAIQATGKALAGVAGLEVLSSMSTAAGLSNTTETPQSIPTDTNSGVKLRIATCQFPVGPSIAENAKYIRDFMHQAARERANLLHTPEACLTGYPPNDIPGFKNFNWHLLRRETTNLRALAKDLKIWLVLGSAHFLDANTRPTDCLYLFDPEGRIVNRYDKCFLTDGQNGDQAHYSAGDRLVTHVIRGVKVGFAICFDVQFPQLYIAYRKMGATVMINSFYDARFKGPNCLVYLNDRTVPTRCADNRMWAICNNASGFYSEWGSFVTRPDTSIPKRLPINKPGMLVHDYPDTLSPGGWYQVPKALEMDMAENTIMHYGTVSNSPRQRNGQSEP